MAGEPTLRRGSEGEAVVDLQSRLTALGYDTGPIDGDFGPLTDAAVRQFQGDSGLVADGIVGPLTWAALEQHAVPVTPPESHVVFVEEPSVSGLTLTYKAARQDRAPIAAGAHVDGWSIEGDGNPMAASDTVEVPFFDATDGVYEIGLQLPELAPGTYTVHVGLTMTSASSEVGHATFTVAASTPPESHVVFVEEPSVSGLTLTYKAARQDRAPIAAGAHVDGWSIEGDGNPMVASDTVAVPFVDAADGVYEVGLQLPELAQGTYTVHVGLTMTSASSEVGHATFTV